MCGIFGYVGTSQIDATSMVRTALCDLEYRGYDSWGIATSTDAGIVTKKAVGKISATAYGDFLGEQSKMAIGHSRWATHGGVSERNSHPHLSHDKTIAVVHNGIVENHTELRRYLAKQFCISEKELFVSETDTEVIPHLIEHFIRQGKSFEQAFIETGKKLEGRFAIVAMKTEEPYLLAMRNGSPLVLGKDARGCYLASDVPAFLDYTRIVCYPGDNECVKMFPNNLSMVDLQTGVAVPQKWGEVLWDKACATKEGHPHFMLKEIMEQPNSVGKALIQESKKLLHVAQKMNAAQHLFFVGCGTAFKIAQLAELYSARIGGKLARAFVGSEFKSYEQFLSKKSLLFAVSQSGETADVLESLRAGGACGSEIISLLNVVGSSMNRMSRETIFINTGPEIAVASTKAATAQIAVLILIAHAQKGLLPEGRALMEQVVKLLTEWVNPKLSSEVRMLAESLWRERNIYIIGRGLNAPIALEAAIKIQEVSYIHAEGFPGGELKHGPIALIEEGTPIIAFVPNDETKTDMISSVTELKSRGAFVTGIGPENSMLFDDWIKTPDLGLASPIASLIPIQLLAYHLAVLRGNDPDKPRNLAKSVTVK